MKYGVRKPSIKKSVSARTKGRVTRTVKRATNPTYGKKGMGWVNDPKKAAYNKVYNKTTLSVRELPNGKKYYTDGTNIYNENEVNGTNKNTGSGCLGCLGFLVVLPCLAPFLLIIFAGLWIMLYSFIHIFIG